MSVTPFDSDLVKAYAVQGSEAAFRSLVQRHVDLVFATAFRQTGNSALAEEIAQNVFISLARKAPRLGELETLSGWLHRATLLEAKARIRAELRRRQREHAAFEMSWLDREGTTPLGELVPMLDEALLNLREGDRLALVLRFLEQRSLREVGAILGVEEDTARKRVARALERVEEFFRRRGFATASAGASAALASSGHAAPASLVSACANAALSNSATGGGLAKFLFYIMKPTKTQTAVACLLVAAVPLAWQFQHQSEMAREKLALDAEAADFEAKVIAKESNAAGIRQVAARTRVESQTSASQLQKIRNIMTNDSPRPRYHWDNSSPYVRIPKPELQIGGRSSAVGNHHGELTPQIKEMLQMNDTESARTEGAIKQFLGKYYAAEARNMQQVTPQPDDLQGHSAEQTRVFDVPYIGAEQMTQMRNDLFSQINSVLGDERTAIFTNSIGMWMPATEDFSGISSDETVFNSNFRARFYLPAPGDSSIQYSVTTGHASMSTSIEPNDVPDIFAPYLQDWTAAIHAPKP